MNTSKLLIGFLLLMLVSSCYKDKGNYDYKNVNDFEVTITPAPSVAERNLYLINQPGTEAETFVLTANVQQTIESSEENLEYTWYRTLSIEGEKEPRQDTIEGKECKLEMAAQKKSTWNVLLVVRENSMELEYYQSLTIQTKTPFTNAWFYLYGEAGARKIGALQWDVTGKAEVIADIMEEMGQPSYPNATGLSFTTSGGVYQNPNQTERLFITSGADSINFIDPFTCKVMGRWRQMGIPGIKIKDKLFVPNMSERPLCGVIDDKGLVYFSSEWGRPSFKQAETKIMNYNVEKAYMDAGGNTVLWDNTNKRLIYCSDGNFMEYVGDVQKNDLQNKEMLWLGRAPKATELSESEPILFIAKNTNNNKCYLYTIGRGSGDDDKALKAAKDKDDEEQEGMMSNTVCDSTYLWKFDKNTLFATSDYFQDQLFYTADNTIYRAILASGESFKLYKPKDGTIKKIAFRITNKSRYVDHMTNIDYNSNLRVMAIIVTKADGTDEIHEIHLSNSGDVEEEHIYNLGQITITDWAFSGMHRNADN